MLFWYLGFEIDTSIRGFIALAMATKGRLPPTALWNPTAHPRITLYLQLTLMM